MPSQPPRQHSNVKSLPEEQQALANTMNSPLMIKPDWPAKFLESLAKHGIILLAAKEAGVSRKTAYRLRDSDSEFKGLWDDAIEAAVDILEATARTRAMHGTKTTMVHRGKPILGQDGKPLEHVRVSDALMIFLLKKYRYPDVIQHTGPGGGPIQVNLSANPSKVLERLGRVSRHIDTVAVAQPTLDAVLVDEDMLSALEREESELESQDE